MIFTQALLLNVLLDKSLAALLGLLKEFGQFGFVLSYSYGMYILPDLTTCLETKGSLLKLVGFFYISKLVL